MLLLGARGVRDDGEFVRDGQGNPAPNFHRVPWHKGREADFEQFVDNVFQRLKPAGRYENREAFEQRLGSAGRG